MSKIVIIIALGTILKGLLSGLEEMEIRGQAVTNQTSVLFRSARILRRVPEICGDLLSLRLR